MTERADAGEIRVPAAQASDQGRLSLIRQTARALGYNANATYRKDKDSGDVILEVNGVRPGFDDNNSEIRNSIEQDRRRIGRKAASKQ